METVSDWRARRAALARVTTLLVAVGCSLSVHATERATPLSRPVSDVLAIGEHAMALRTHDIATAHARLRELGARYPVPPVSTDDGSATEPVVYDPDGLRIHVVQRPNSPCDV